MAESSGGPHTNQGDSDREKSRDEASRFLQSLFAPDDLILFRPIETWTDEDGKKHSKVVYQSIQHRRLGLKHGAGGWIYAPATIRNLIDELLKTGASNRANIFFGVAPRFGGEGKFDKAWQIRKVRSLWADLDGTSPEQAIERCERATIPQPSIVVRSGNGVHLYWLLEDPWIIDDADPPTPPALFIERPSEEEKAAGKKSRSYILDGTEKKYLNRETTPDMSAKALKIQDIVSGIAHQIGGDHTHDISRILRVPGTLNRKDERNGKKPTQCTLAIFETGRKYRVADFERFEEFSPSRKDRLEIAKIVLEKPRPITSKKHHRTLADLVNKCIAADDRSIADYHLCCVAVERGWSQSEVWAAVENVGKFSERGHVYFLGAWNKAEAATRRKIWEQAKAKQAAKKQKQDIERAGKPIPTAPADEKAAPGFHSVLLAKVGLEVLGRYSDGKIKVFSKSSQKVEAISNIDRYGYANFAGLCGPRLIEHVARVKEEGCLLPDLKDLQEAIGICSHTKELRDGAEVGVGCWRGINSEKVADGTVVVIGSRQAFVWDGKELRNNPSPFCGGHIVDFETPYKPWFNPDDLRGHLARSADTDFRQAVLEEARELFGRWRWQHPSMPLTATGLAFATWIQALWNWRPQILVGGVSHSGKTTLFSVLEGIFGNLVCKSSQSTAAGLRQSLACSARVPICDEFDSTTKSELRNQSEILKMVRSSGRGDMILRGSANQKVHEFILRHVFWMAGTNVEFESSTDKNRFIVFELEGASPGMEGKLQVPSLEQLQSLGQRMLAVSIYCGVEATRLASHLTKTTAKHGKTHARQVESFAVPAAMLATIRGDSEEAAREILATMLAAVVDEREMQITPDHEKLMHDILMAKVPTREAGKKPVSFWLSAALQNNTESIQILENHGIRLDTLNEREAAGIDGASEGDRCIMLATDVLQRDALEGTSWQTSGMKHAIKSFGRHVTTSRRRLCGRVVYMRIFSLDYIRREFLEKDSEGADSEAGKQADAF